MRNDKIEYKAFADISGGRHDSSTLCIAHSTPTDGGKTVICDYLKGWKGSEKMNPYSIIAEMSRILKEYGIRTCHGDNYAADLVLTAFQGEGIKYIKSKLSASQLYLELLPRLNSGRIELLDNEDGIEELCGLIRRTRSGTVCDLNAASKKQRFVGGLSGGWSRRRNIMSA
jgi:hypothetical protein